MGSFFPHPSHAVGKNTGTPPPVLGTPTHGGPVSVPGRMWLSVWRILSFFFLVPLLFALLLPEQVVRSMAAILSQDHPWGQSCPLCGMTGAFLAIAKGDFGHATQLNGASLPLWGILLANGWAAGHSYLRELSGRGRSPFGHSPNPENVR